MQRRPFIKICGITTPDDALLAAGLGADAVGMIFAASSSRITRGRARDIVRRLPPEVLTVGVFRNESRERVVELANTIGMRAVQLHGHETAEDTRWVAARVPNVIRAFAATDPALRRHEDYGDVRLLIDAPQPGSGVTFDWNLLDESPIAHRFILAGGLDPENVVAAMETARPWGIDVKTGVESRPGHKDPVKLQQFIARAREAGERVGTAPFDWADWE
jgi:phosphoribosylanthranilate isomerase